MQGPTSFNNSGRRVENTNEQARSGNGPLQNIVSYGQNRTEWFGVDRLRSAAVMTTIGWVSGDPSSTSRRQMASAVIRQIRLTNDFSSSLLFMACWQNATSNAWDANCCKGWSRSVVCRSISLSRVCALQKKLNWSTSCFGWRLLVVQGISC